MPPTCPKVVRQLDQLFVGLIEAAHHYGGSVIGFAGDAMLVWFEKDIGPRALTAAWAIRATTQTSELTPRFVVSAGCARRFGVGYPIIQLMTMIIDAPHKLDALTRCGGDTA